MLLKKNEIPLILVGKFNLHIIRDKDLLMAKAKNTHTVIVHDESCKGCGLCIEYCKSEKLAFSTKLNKMGYFYAEPVKDKECTGCMSCTLVCPDLVIEVYDG